MTSAILSVRMNALERDLVVSAAAKSRTTVSDFIRRKALEAAEMDVANHPVVTIPAKDWERFEAWTARPPRDLPKLRALAARKATRKAAWGD
jgi:uncharacterized protein (DUF1778 family)